MPNLSGLTPLTIQVTDALLSLTQNLKPNQPYRSIVTGTPQGQSVTVNGSRIALPANTTLTPGQPVTVELQTQSGAPRLVVQPAPTAQPSAAPNPVASTLLMEVLRAIPQFQNITPQQATGLMPTPLPASDALIRLALQVFQFQATLPEAVDTMRRALSLVTTQKDASPEARQLLTLLGAGVDFTKTESIAQFLKNIRALTTSAPLADLAPSSNASPQPASASDASLYRLLAGIRNDQTVLALLETPGAIKTFQQASDTLLDHAAGQHLQNARGLDTSYVYLNIPIANDALRQAQIHFFADGQQNQDDSGAGQIVMDLDTTNLGSIWIHIQHSPENCTCRFNVNSEEIVGYINHAADSLVTRLEGLSFKHVQVLAMVWDGDRIQALADVIQQFAGLDIKA